MLFEQYLEFLKMEKLLTRDNFRNNALKRDDYKCVNCGCVENLSVHHLLERRLFDDGGYYLSNAATLCEPCHIKAEETTLSCEELRTKIGIINVILPENLYDDLVYDKWGNIILNNGRRIKGELFFDESVQKILKQGDVLKLFDDYVKYPRTYHFDFSNPSKDDKVLKDYSALLNEEIVVTTKLDGENTSLMRNYAHARSLEPLFGQDRGWVKSLHARISHDIPEYWRICGENLYATHSIHYSNLESYFYCFSIWNEINECLSWNETLEWCELLELNHVPVLYKGIFDYNLLKKMAHEMDYSNNEGFVVRPTRSFKYGEFKKVMVKNVRKNHITTDNHWRHKQIIPNSLKNSQQK